MSPLRERLEHRDPERRLAAIRQAVDDPAAALLLEPLVEALGDPAKGVARGASDAVVTIPTEIRPGRGYSTWRATSPAGEPVDFETACYVDFAGSDRDLIRHAPGSTHSQALAAPNLRGHTIAVVLFGASHPPSGMWNGRAESNRVTLP